MHDLDKLNYLLVYISFRYLFNYFHIIRGNPYFQKFWRNLNYFSFNLIVDHATLICSLKNVFSDLSGNGLAMCVEDESVLANTSLPTLRTLKFASNRVRTIPARAFENFPALQNLDLTDNPIASVQNGAFESLHLRRL